MVMMTSTINTELPADLAALCARIEWANPVTLAECVVLSFVLDVAPHRPDICRDLARRLGVRV